MDFLLVIGSSLELWIEEPGIQQKTVEFFVRGIGVNSRTLIDQSWIMDYEIEFF